MASGGIGMMCLGVLFGQDQDEAFTRRRRSYAQSQFSPSPIEISNIFHPQL